MRSAFTILLSLFACAGAQASPVQVWPSPRAVTPDEDGRLRFELVVVNTGVDMARDVVVRDGPGPDSALVAAEPPPLLEAGWTWAVGDLPPGGSARIELVLDGPDAGAEVAARVGANVRRARALPVVIADAAPPALRAPTIDADAADPEILALAARLEGDPARIEAFVRSRVAYLPYHGSLRGARGALWSGAGNAWDQASLAIALLRASGVSARYARGTLPDEAAAERLRTLLPSRTRPMYPGPSDNAVVEQVNELAQMVPLMPPEVGEGLAALTPEQILEGRNPDPGADAALLAIAREHAWVEVWRDGAFVPFDPTGPGAVPEADATLSEVPAELRHTATVEVAAKLYNPAFGLAGGGGDRVLSVTLPTARLPGRPMRLQTAAIHDLAPGLLFSVQTNTYTPQLWLGDALHAEGEPIQEIISNFPASTTVLVELTVTLRLTEPAAETPRVFTHYWVDQIGAARRAGARAEPGEVVEQQVGNAFAGIEALAIGAVAWKIPKHRARGVAIRAQAATATLNQVAGDLEVDPIEAEDPADHQRYRDIVAALADVDAVLAEALLTRFFHQAGRLEAIFAHSLESTAWVGRAQPAFVSMTSDVGGPLPRLNAPTGPMQVVSRDRANQNLFNHVRGLALSSLEGRVLAPLVGPVLDVDSVFSAAIEQGVPPRPFGANNLAELKRLGLPADADAAISAAIADGKLIIAPTGMVQMATGPELVWYEHDPVTGHTVSVGINGDHPATVERVGADQLAGELSVFVVAITPAFGFLQSMTLGVTTWALDGARAAKQKAGAPARQVAWGCFMAIVRWVGKAVCGALTEGLGGFDPCGALEAGAGDYPGSSSLATIFVHGAVQATYWGLASYAALKRTLRGKALLIVAAQVGMCIGQLVATQLWRSVQALLDESDPPLGVLRVSEAAVFHDPPNRHDRPLPGALGAAPDLPDAPPVSWRIVGALSVESDGPAATSAARLRADDAQVLDLDGQPVAAGALDLDVEAVVAEGPLTITGEGHAAGHFEVIAVVLADGRVNAASAVLIADLGDGPTPYTVLGPLELTTRAPLAVSEAAVEAMDARLELGARAFAGFTGRLDGALAGEAIGVLEVAGLPEAIEVDRGAEVVLEPIAQGDVERSLTWSVAAPDGWVAAVWPDGTVRARATEDAVAGDATLYVWATADEGPPLVAGGAVRVTLGEGPPGVEVALTHVPNFTTPLRNGVEAPLLVRADVVHRGEGPATYAVEATAEGYVATPAADALTLHPGEAGAVFVALDLLPEAELPAPGAPIVLTVRLSGPGAEGADTLELPFPEVPAGRLELARNLFDLAPAEQVETTLTVRSVGNAPGRLDLVFERPGGVVLEGIPESVDLAVGDAPRVFPVRVGVGEDVVPRVGYVAGIGAFVGEVPQGEALVGITVVAPEARPAIGALEAATNNGFDDLAPALGSLSDDLDAIVEACNDATRVRLANTLQRLVADLTDPVFRDLSSGFRAYGIALRQVDCEDVDLAPLIELLERLAARLPQVAAHDFRLALAPARAVLEPGEDATFTLTVADLGGAPTTLGLALQDVPGEVVEQIEPGPVDAPTEVEVTVRPPGPGRYLFTVRAHAVEAPEVVREVRAAVLVSDAWVRIVSLRAEPPFAVPGAQLNVRLDLFNVINAPIDLRADVTLEDADGQVVWAGAEPVEFRLPTAPGVHGFDIGAPRTFGLEAGRYTVRVALTNGQGRAVPGGIGEGVVLLGQPVRATAAVEPVVLPPGDLEAMVRLAVERRPHALPPGAGVPTRIRLFSSTAEGPVGLAEGPDGSIYVSNFGSERELPGGSPGAGNTVSRITPEGEVLAFAELPEAPVDMTIGPDGALYVVNVGRPERINRIDLDDGSVRPWYDFTTNRPEGQDAINPLGIAFDDQGDAFVAELWRFAAFGITQPADWIYKVHRDQDDDGMGDRAEVFVRDRVLSEPARLTIDPRTQDLIVGATEEGRGALVRVNTVGEPTAQVLAEMALPNGVAFDDAGNLYAVDARTGVIQVWETAVVDGHTELVGEPYSWLEGLGDPIGLIFAADGDAVTTHFDDDQVIRVTVRPPAPPVEVSLDVAHRIGALRAGALEDSAPEAEWDDDGPRWARALAPEDDQAVFDYAHRLEDLEPGQVLTLGEATTVTYRVGEAEAIVELPPLLAVVDHIVGVAPDRFQLARETPRTVTLSLTNHRAEADVYTLEVTPPDGITAQHPATVEVPANGRATVELELFPNVDAPLGVGQLEVRVTAGLGGADRAFANVNVVDRNLEMRIEPRQQVVSWGDEVTVELFIRHPGGGRLAIDLRSEGLSEVAEWTNFRAQPGDTREIGRGAFDIVGVNENRVPFTFRAIGPPGQYVYRFRSGDPFGRNPPQAVSPPALLTILDAPTLSVALEPLEVVAGRGDHGHTTATITNTGNRVVEFEVALDMAGIWDRVFDPGPYSLAPGASRRVPIALAPGNFDRDFTVIARHPTEEDIIARSPTGRARRAPLSGQVRVEPATVDAVGGAAEATVVVRRESGRGEWALAVESPIGWAASLDDERLEINGFSAEASTTLRLDGLDGLAPGPWPVRVLAWPVEAPEMVDDAVLRVRVVGGGVGATLDPAEVFQREPAPFVTRLRVRNRDFQAARALNIGFVSEPPGLEATVDDPDFELAPGGVTERLVRVTPVAPGQFTLRAVVTPDLGAPAEATLTANILDPALAPVIERVRTVPDPPLEGAPFVLHIDASDADDEALLYDFDLDDDGVFELSEQAEPTVERLFPDEAVWSVRVAVSDPNGGRAEEDAEIVVLNVPPSIDSEPGEAATEGEPYRYAVEVSDPGLEDVVALRLSAAPEGAELVDGEVRWTPDFDAALAGDADFVVRADDGDGGEAEQAWRVAVAFGDGDGDGFPDTCAERWGVEGPGDDDGDGRSNLLECLRGSDPRADGRPGAPVPLRPEADEVVLDGLRFEVEPPQDPDGDAISGYHYQLIDADEMVVLEIEGWPAPEWAPDEEEIPADGLYTWRARATDGAGYGPWSEPVSFRLGAEPDVGAPDLGVPDVGVPDAMPDVTVDVGVDAAADAAPLPDAMRDSEPEPDVELDVAAPEDAEPDLALEEDAAPPEADMMLELDASPSLDASEVRPDAEPLGDGRSDGGCGCHSAGSGPSGAPLLLLLLCAYTRRGRRA